MDFATIVTIAGIIVGILGIAYGVNKHTIKSSGNLKNIKDSTVTISNVNIGENNKIIKGDKDGDK